MPQNQSDLMRYLLLGGASFFAARTASKLIKWGILGGLAWFIYQDIQKNKGGLAGNSWGVSMDYQGMVNEVFPDLGGKHSAMVATALGNLFERMTRV